MLNKSGIDGLLIIQRADLFYLTGTAQNGCLYLPADGTPLLFVKRYLPRARKESPLENVVAIRSMSEVPDRIIDACGRLPATLGLEWDVLPVRDFNYISTLFPTCDLVDGSMQILNVLKIKSTWELRQMSETAEMSRKTFQYMQKAIRAGLTEMEFAGMFETYARKLGHGGMLRTRHFQTEGYPWHVLSGSNGGKVGLLDSPMSGEGTSAAFPNGAGSRPLAANEPILVDFGAVRNGYHIDETRMFAIGSMPDKARRACEASIDIQQSLLALARPGITTGALFDHSVALADRLGFAEAYLGPPGHKVNFVGHGIGVELIEPPFIARGKTDSLEPGMTFALEPKMCFEGEFAAGIESVFCVTDQGAEMISTVPVKIFECANI